MNETLFILWLIGFAGEPKPAEPVDFIALSICALNLIVLTVFDQFYIQSL